MNAKTPEALPPLSKETQAQMLLPVRIDLEVVHCLALLGTLQLALRHPEFIKRPTAGWIKGFAENLQKEITRLAPGLDFLCEMGWNERFDR